MKIIIELSNKEANRQIEDVEENIRPAYKEIIRTIENICGEYQIRYVNIEITENE